MPLQLEVEIPETGAVVTYHEVASYSVDLSAKRSAAVVFSYVSALARANGKQAMHVWHIPAMEGVPPAEAAALAWVEEELIKPESEPQQSGPLQPGQPALPIYTGRDRWTFAGAIRI